MNAEVLVLATAGLKPLANFARELRLPFAVLSDAGGETYRAFELGRGLVIRRHTVVEFLRLVWEARHFFFPIGDVMQMGGNFIVDGAGIVR